MMPTLTVRFRSQPQGTLCLGLRTRLVVHGPNIEAHRAGLTLLALHLITLDRVDEVNTPSGINPTCPKGQKLMLNVLKDIATFSIARLVQLKEPTKVLSLIDFISLR